MVGNGKPFAMDKSDQNPAAMTRLESFYDFFVFIGLSIAYIVQVSDNNILLFCQRSLNSRMSLASMTNKFQ